jgi:hypothetical protein
VSEAPPLLSTAGIDDPQIRNWLDRLTQVWQAREAGDDRYITASEFSGLAGDAVAQAFSEGVVGGGSGTSKATVTAAINVLSDSIRKSVLYRVLEQQINPDEYLAFRKRLDAALISAGKAISTVGAGLASEVVTRTSKDMALASAINRVWAYVGGATAVIEDGALAAATPSSAVATKWNAVVAAVTDPNTGEVNAASIVQELDTYASSADDTFNAIYSVRAQIDYNGATVVGGFGLAATAGAGSPDGPNIDFGVLANKFFIGAPASGYVPATEYGTNLQFPFIVVTTPTTINGVTYAPGVYIKSANIGEASIDTAKISQHINSTNFNGSFDGSGNISGYGSAGWAIDKSGLAVFNNVKVRGDIEANSITANTVTAGNLQSGAVATGYIAETASGTSCSVSVTIPTGAYAIYIHADFGASQIIVGSGKDMVVAQNNNTGYITYNGSPLDVADYAIMSPSPGTFSIGGVRSLYSGTGVTQMTVVVEILNK